MMSYTLENGLVLPLIIEYKNIKNMYLRIKDEKTIYISAPKNISFKKIDNFIKDNEDNILKIIKKRGDKTSLSNNEILFEGRVYKIIPIKNRKVVITNDKIYLYYKTSVDTFYKNICKEIFLEHLKSCYEKFLEEIPMPSLNVRKMKSKWGVCNVTRCVVTLNQELIKYDLKYLDYVIVHELAHLIHPNHSKKFWDVVMKYEKNYKILRKEMKDFVL